MTLDQSSDPHFSAYVRTDFNKDIAPSEYLWSTVKNRKTGLIIPNQSPQIFRTEMSSDILASKTQTIEGLTITTALISIPTIENPVFKTKAGQKVEVLPTVLNSKVPTVVIGKEQIQEQTGPLAEMASRDIFSNQELVRRVNFFL